jgi:hypothetical protein
MGRFDRQHFIVGRKLQNVRGNLAMQEIVSKWLGMAVIHHEVPAAFEQHAMVSRTLDRGVRVGRKNRILRGVSPGTDGRLRGADFHLVCRVATKLIPEYIR